MAEKLREVRWRVIGKCLYCKDPIYSRQETDPTKKYHKGCKKIEEAEKSK